MTTIVNGVWPTMITPFTTLNEVDYPQLEKLIEWYIARGVHGLFAVCQSSEMFALSLEERILVSRFTVEKAAGRVPVISSGHISDSIEDQIKEIKAIAETGIEAFVLVTNRLAASDESDEIWKANATKILEALPDVKFGMYECPYPYKRLTNPALLQWCNATGRFLFLKDTCCDPQELKARLEALKGSQLKIYNANSATLLESMRLGAAGFSGIMANFHPELYVWLTENWSLQPERAEELQDFLSIASMIETKHYPINAKYNILLEGIPCTLASRVKEEAGFLPDHRILTEQLHRISKQYSASFQ